MKKPENLTARSQRTGIHLLCAPARSFNGVVCQIARERKGVIATATIDNDNFGARRGGVHMFEKSADDCGFI